MRTGIAAGSALEVTFGLDMPMYVLFGNGGGLVIPVLFGFGVEYFLSHNLALAFGVKMGPSVDTRPLFARSYFAFESTLGLAYKF